MILKPRLIAVSAVAAQIPPLTPVHLFNPKLGAEGMRPLQHKVRDPFSVSKTVVRNDESSF